jgi:FtsP/CotA-like multicopper oxidase with cupredoxin domain
VSGCGVIDRRQFLMLGAAAGAAAACADAGQAPAGPTASQVTLAARETDIDLGGVTVRTWTYGNQLPGKETRLRKGERLQAELTNSLPQDVTVHWHGLAIPNPMDGVPVLTQAPVPKGQTFTYDFVVPDAGTYWFHSHVGTQLDRGLYGPLIIEDPDERADYDELVVIVDDWIDGTGTNPDQVLENLRKTGMKPMAPGGMGVSPPARWARTLATSPTRTSSSMAVFPPTRKQWITLLANGLGCV